MSTANTEFHPDFASYHRSLVDELEAVRNRVRQLIPHWATDGAFKETALRTILRRHLPESLTIGSGFIVSRNQCSSQIDVLVVDASKPTLFKDGDLLIVTPDMVKGIVEVKTALSGPSQIAEVCRKLTANAQLCHEGGSGAAGRVFTGVFVYDPSPNQERHFLTALDNSANLSRIPINCICYGGDILIPFFQDMRLPRGRTVEHAWVCWNVPRLAPAYFLGLMLDCWCRVATFSDGAAWMPNQATNRQVMCLRAYHDGAIEEFPANAGDNAEG